MEGLGDKLDTEVMMKYSKAVRAPILEIWNITDFTE